MDENLTRFYSDPQTLLERADKGWVPSRFHDFLMRRSIATALQRNGRLIVEAPVRHGKSTAITRGVSVWLQATHPDIRQWSVSHTDGLAKKFGRRIRLDLQEVLPLFGRQLDSTSSAVSSFHVEGFPGGGWEGISALAVPSGDGPDVLIIDDPIKTAEQVRSSTFRDEMWEWWRGTMTARLNPGASIIFVMSRWHHDDIVGRIKQAENWPTITLRALKQEGDDDYYDERRKQFWFPREVGDALRPSVMPVPEILARRDSMAASLFAANYQAEPQTVEGKMIKGPLEARQIVVSQAVRGWDLASTYGGGDWTVAVLIGVHPQGWHVVDVNRFQLGPGDVEREILATARRDGPAVPIVIPVDPGQAGKAQQMHLSKLLAGFQVVFVGQHSSKETRAQGWASQINNGTVTLEPAVWNQNFRTEHHEFPLGAHDDQVDAAVIAFNLVVERAARGVTVAV